MSGGLDPHYDFALLGTSLPLSILSAALSRIGYSVLHIDEEEHYGGPWSSLTLTELLEWSHNSALHQSQGKRNISISFPAFKEINGQESNPPPELAALNRHFSISLSPTIVPCAGPTIDVLIRSNVASYCTFRLLQKTSVYSATTSKAGEWPLRKVPSSKEDIFKDKSLSLVDKRRLMKLLQLAVPSQEDPESNSASKVLPSDGTFFDYLLSKEGASLSPELARSIAYGVALCSSEQDTTAVAMERIRRHITGIGRYGNAAYLVGQYGGAGEMAQCFCRASAVRGGTFVLGHRLETCSREGQGVVGDDEQASNWSLSLEGIEGSTKVEHIVGDDDMLERLLPSELNSDSSSVALSMSVSGVLLLDRGIPFEDVDHQEAEEVKTLPPETGLVVFPPGKEGSIGAVTALQMAEGTFSCPKGMYLIYLSASVMDSSDGKVEASKELKQARDEILKLVSRSTPEWRSEGVDVESRPDSTTMVPLMECYYTSEERPTVEEKRGKNLWYVKSTTTSVATSLDEATLKAETLFWDIMGKEKRSQAEEKRRRRKPIGYTVGRGLGGVIEGTESETICDFFPREETEVDEDD